MQTKQNHLFRALMLIGQGILVGFGAILPGVSGGALLAAFGLYKPVLFFLASPVQGFRKYWKLFLFLGIGGVIGFVGLSGIAAILLAANAPLVTCVFMGFIFGTLPSLWRDAGRSVDRRGVSCFLSLGLGLVLMLALLLFLNGTAAVHITPGFWAYVLCGVAWGLSLIVPGMSASTLLLFFGLYQPMLDGIAHLSPAVCLPLLGGALACIALLSRLVKLAFARCDAVMSHAIFGIVLATTIMIFPGTPADVGGWALYALCIAGGAVVSYFLDRLCDRIRPAEGAADPENGDF